MPWKPSATLRSDTRQVLLRPCSKVIVKLMMMKHGYIGEFEIVDDHRAGKIVVNLNGRLNKVTIYSKSSILTLNNFFIYFYSAVSSVLDSTSQSTKSRHGPRICCHLVNSGKLKSLLNFVFFKKTLLSFFSYFLKLHCVDHLIRYYGPRRGQTKTHWRQNFRIFFLNKKNWSLILIFGRNSWRQNC